jgi:nifR3 family TIM-barrel protein
VPAIEAAQTHFFAMNPPAFYIRQIPVYGDLILSPMDGYSDQPYRALCRSLGSAMSYTEFINALDVLQGHPHLSRKLAYLEAERPVVYQIFDSEPERLLEVALRLQEHEPDIIDVNMGCSVRCVSGRGAGAGLLREPGKVAQIFRLLSRSLKVPLTAKMRLGWDDDSRNYCLIARAVEENGGALIAVHGRTRSQAYGGQADWQAIAEIKQSVSIPVIANGDVSCVADIDRIKAVTSCDGVMIGRAAIGNPWIFSRLDRDQVPAALLHDTMELHLKSMLDFYGPERGLVLFRKHASRYLAPLELSPEQRQRLLTSDRPVEFLQTLSELNA